MQSFRIYFLYKTISNAMSLVCQAKLSVACDGGLHARISEIWSAKSRGKLTFQRWRQTRLFLFACHFTKGGFNTFQNMMNPPTAVEFNACARACRIHGRLRRGSSSCPCPGAGCHSAAGRVTHVACMLIVSILYHQIDSLNWKISIVLFNFFCLHMRAFERRNIFLIFLII